MRNPTFHRAVSAVTFASVTMLAATSAAATDAKSLVDVLNGISGKQAVGQRASHAKGQCIKGTFTSDPAGKAVTTSLAFDGPVPVLGRFSMGGGNPKIADATKGAVRGIAFKVDPEGKKESQFVFVNAPVHFAANLEQQYAVLQSRLPGPDGKPDPAKTKAFADANPAVKAQGAYLASKPVPASYVGVPYFGVHGLQATGAGGAKSLIKLKLVPAAEAGLTDDEAKAKPADFLVSELTERLAKGPQTFKFVAIMGKPGDRTDDLTVRWADEDARPTVTLGTLSIMAIEPNATCDAGIFDPTIMAAGLAPSADDTLFAIRAPVYAVSISRRSGS